MVKFQNKQINILNGYWTKISYIGIFNANNTIISTSVLNSVSITKLPNGRLTPTSIRGILTGDNTNNIVIIRNADNKKTILDLDGNLLFGRITYNNDNYVISYYYDNGGPESIATLPSTMEIEALFPEVMEFDEIPSDVFLMTEAGWGFGVDGYNLSLNYNPTKYSVVNNSIGSHIAALDKLAVKENNKYFYGKDARKIAKLLCEGNVSLLQFGDSRSLNIGQYASTAWGTNILLGGFSFNSINTVKSENNGIWSSTLKSQISGNSNDNFLIGLVESECISATTQAEDSFNDNDICFGGTSYNNYAKAYQAMSGHELKLHCLFKTNTGASNLYLQFYNPISSYYERSDKFNLVGTGEIIKKTLTIPSTTDIGTGTNGINCSVLFSPTDETIVGEKFLMTRNPWVEIEDGTGVVIHDMSVSGLSIEDLLNDGNYTNSNQFPEQIVKDEFYYRTYERIPVIAINIGTYSSSTQSKFESKLTQLIERLRNWCNSPNCPIILRTSYPSSSSEETTYYQLGAIAVANRMDNVLCWDSYGIINDLGNYGWLINQNYMSDEILMNHSGKVWLEEQFDTSIGEMAL